VSNSDTNSMLIDIDVNLIQISPLSMNIPIILSIPRDCLWVFTDTDEITASSWGFRFFSALIFWNPIITERCEINIKIGVLQICLSGDKFLDSSVCLESIN